MKNWFVIVFMSAIVSCSGDQTSDSEEDLISGELSHGWIIEFSTEECFCCSNVKIELDGVVYQVEDFPEITLEEADLPIEVFVKTSEYKGQCSNMDLSVEYSD